MSAMIVGAPEATLSVDGTHLGSVFDHLECRHAPNFVPLSRVRQVVTIDLQKHGVRVPCCKLAKKGCNLLARSALGFEKLCTSDSELLLRVRLARFVEFTQGSCLVLRDEIY